MVVHLMYYTTTLKVRISARTEAAFLPALHTYYAHVYYIASSQQQLDGSSRQTRSYLLALAIRTIACV